MRSCLLGLTLLVGLPAAAQDMAELELDHSMRTEIAAPHTDWATPYVQGKTRVLFFLNGRGTVPREAIELCQRFDFDAQMVFWARIVDTTRDDWHGGENGVRRMARLLEQKWDAFVFLEAAPERMPVEQQYALVKAVTEGAGLVLIGLDEPRVLKVKNRINQLPASLSDVTGAAAFTVKHGRGVRLPSRPTIAYRRGWEVDYDQWSMRVGKAILWAAGKEPRLTLTFAASGKPLDRAALPAAAATLRWQGAAGQAVADVALRRDDGAVVQRTRHTLSQPSGEWRLNMPRLRSGRYWLDVVARTGDRVAGFASQPFDVVCQQRIASVTLDPNWAEIGQTLAGKVELAGGARPGQQIIVSLLDRRGREIARQVLPANATERAFRFKVEPWFPMLVEVRAVLIDGGEELASAWQFARVVQRHRGQFNFVMWDTPGGNLAPIAEESLARTGVTIHLASARPSDLLAAYDMAYIPYTTHVAALKDDQGVMKPACWNDERAIQAHVDQIVAKSVAARRHGVFVYSLGDEIAVRGSCLSPHCLAAYQKYLAEQYGDIAALNASWGTSLARFEDVRLANPNDNDETESLRVGNFPRWYDRQAFQSYNFCQLCARFGQAFRRIDPQSRCGFEGAGTFTHADDLDGFARYNTFWSPYPGTADEVLRSIAPRDFPRANWMGYTKDADTLLEKYWRMVTRGCDSVWWWRWDVLGRFHGWLAPSLDPYPAVKETLADTQIVRDGLGDLLLASEMQTDGIGILYSQPSAYAAKVLSSSFGSYEGSHNACHGWLRELGFNFRYFTDRQMRLGEVDFARLKVILLPMTQALGRHEADLLRDYVRQGGVLIADVQPGICDGHIKPLAAGLLDDVFGIRRTGLASATVRDGAVTLPSTRAETLDLAKVRVDPAVQATQASAAGSAGKTPLVLTNRFGKGRAVLLNVSMASIPALSAESTPAAVAELLRTLLGADLSPHVSLKGPHGPRLRNVEITRWLNGPVQIVSVFRHHGQAETATLHLPQAMQVYDLKARRSLGRVQDVPITFTPSRAAFYAIAAPPLEAVAIKAPPAVAPGGVGRISLRSKLPQGGQAVRLEVRLPDGRLADWVRRVAVVGPDGVHVDVPVAYNDPPGRWTIRAVELYTGAASTASFQVQTSKGAH
jgi:hypothetical protein